MGRHYSELERLEKGYIGIVLDPAVDFMNRHPRKVIVGLLATAFLLEAYILVKPSSHTKDIWEAVAEETVNKADSLSSCTTISASMGLPWRRFPMKICGVKRNASDMCVNVSDDWQPPRSQQYCFIPQDFSDAKILKLGNN